MKAICPMCGKKGVQLTEHHVKELGRNRKGEIETIGLCQKCHDSHNLYVNALKKLGLNIDRTRKHRKRKAKSKK